MNNINVLNKTMKITNATIKYSSEAANRSATRTCNVLGVHFDTRHLPYVISAKVYEFKAFSVRELANFLVHLKPSTEQMW